ncbi:MAG TPA: hypothetical protein VLF90_01615 [Patescibacteria group bacterium]|nr:hypothetical protein [Patescibacteria group bacterium]
MSKEFTHNIGLSTPNHSDKFGEAQSFQPSFEGVEQKPLVERIDDFKRTLLDLHDVRSDQNVVINLDLPDPTDYSIRFFRQEEVVDSPHTPHRLYLNKAIGSDAINQTLKSSDFIPRKYRSGKFSAHGVFFGDLRIETNNGVVEEIPVAVKPHEDDAGEANDSCLLEYVNTLAVAEMGVYTLQPVGIINGRKRAYSLTLLDEDITTLDSIDWRNFYPDIDKDPGMIDIWSQVARQAAMLHSIGNIMHGDLAARNIATTVDDTAFFIDWEMANISKQKTHGSLTSWAFAHSDIDRLIASMCVLPDPKYGGGIGIFTGKEGDWWGAFKRIFFDEYASYRLAFAETNKTEAETQKELGHLATSLEQTMELFQLAPSNQT